MPLAPSVRFGAYEIVARLGAGGMGEVWRARDTRLDRDVALKVLPAAMLTDEIARARLTSEARMASKLNHPNICTIHEVGEAEGQVYIAMEFLDGQPLSARLSGGALPVEEVLRHGQQVADALSHAHERGIVHRDLKSANVVITPEGRAKVLDFGLAKRLAREDLATASTRSLRSLTTPGMVAGTLPYMAPEQLRGRAADARSDIWALGVVLYEMAAGRLPFQGGTAFELSSAILDQPPLALPPGVPVPLATLIGRCLAKDPGRRFQRAGEVRAALETVQSGGVITLRPAWRYAGTRRRWVLAAAMAMATIVAGVVWLDVGGLRSRLLGRVDAPARTIRLVVLPFANLSGDPEQEYLSDGLTQEMIAQLGRLHPQSLSVIARTSVMRYKKSDTPIDQIGRELGVDYALEGSAQREGSQIRISAQLIQVQDQTQLWAGIYEREMSGILALQSDVTREVAGALALRLLPAEQARLANARSVNPEAYELCLKGRFHWYKLSREELDTAEQYFRAALDSDPNSALAHEGLSRVWMSRTDAGFQSPSEALPKAIAAVQRAIDLDDSLADAHATLGNLRVMDWDWSGAESEFRRAIKLNPNSAGARFSYADFLITMRRVDEWEAEIRRTLELDPLNFFFQTFYGWHMLYERRYDEAIGQFNRVLATEPGFSSAHMGLWGAFYKKAMDADALAEAKKFFAVLGDREVVDALDRGYTGSGYRGAMRLAGETLAARSERSYVPGVRIARVFAHAGENDRALTFLEKAYERRETALYHIGVGWDWDSLRQDPRFQSLLRRMGLPQK